MSSSITFPNRPRHTAPLKNMRLFYCFITVTASITTIFMYFKTLDFNNQKSYESNEYNLPPRLTSLQTRTGTDGTEYFDEDDDVVFSDDHEAGSPPDGLHLCTCLGNDHDADAEIPKRLRWLHFPKTGTSFISTLWSYACSTRERYIDLGIESFQCDIFTGNAFSMYDFALMK
jgi:hypothetical protein